MSFGVPCKAAEGCRITKAGAYRLASSKDGVWVEWKWGLNGTRKHLVMRQTPAALGWTTPRPSGMDTPLKATILVLT
jgi:hypothetical protein